MICRLSLGIFLSGMCAMAQPWQWELYQGDYYNPTGFPFPSTDVCSGDFNGDGRSETVGPVGDSFLVATKDSGEFHWTTAVSGNAPGWAWGHDAYDLDGDGADELVLTEFGIGAWKATASDPWTWQQRNDLVEGFLVPGAAIEGVFGDFDGDGLLNGFFMTADWMPSFELAERLSNGTWVTDTTFTCDGISSGIYTGDFDHDGDEDLAIAPQISDIVPCYGFVENLSPGMAWRLSDPTVFFRGPNGGDIDDDGEWEGLFLYEGYPGSMLVEVEADPEHFLRITDEHYLSSLPGPVFGNFRVNGQTVVGATRNWLWGMPFEWNDSFVTMARMDSGWQDFHCGFNSGYPFSGYLCVGGNRADMDGDGLEDIFAELLDNLMDGGTETYWGILTNHGTAAQDSFSLFSPSVDYFTHRFLANPDTFFGLPQIGDITGDGRAELAVVAVPSGGARQVLFYEMIGEVEDTNFVLRPEWSEGIPTGWDRIRMADIDGDGLAELLTHNPGNPWHAFFRRNGTWVEYENILPDVTDNNISFADADNDGDMDLFAGNQLYYSLSPSRTPHDFIPHPLSFSLSAYPNPFNGTVTIRYDVPRRGEVQVAIYNLLGERIAVLSSGVAESGSHAVQWQPQVSSGIYFARLDAAGGRMMRKIVYLR